jgi:hypothetical protein
VGAFPRRRFFGGAAGGDFGFEVGKDADDRRGAAVGVSQRGAL